MKRILIILLTIVLFQTGDVFGQFNQSTPNDSATVWDIAKCSNDDFITASHTGFRRYNSSGAIIWQRRYTNIPEAVAINNFNQGRLIHTDDDGVIYFSFEIIMTQVSMGVYNTTIRPFALKLDASGNFVWAKKYGMSYWTGAWTYFANFVKIDARRMENTGTSEKYIFSSTGSPSESTLPPYNAGNALNILCIDGSGNLIWDKKYTEKSGAAYTVKDAAQTICYAGYDSQHGNLYYVSGSRVEYPFLAPEDYRWMFKMVIDENGNIVEKYRRILNPCSYTGDGHAIYDPSRRVIMHTFTMGDCNLTPGPEASVIAVESINPNLSINWYNYYWSTSSIENYVRRIEATSTRDEFILSGWYFDNDYFSGLFSSARATLFKIRSSSTTGTALWQRHYMVGENTQSLCNGLIATTLDADHGGGESYVFPDRTKPTMPFQPDYNARLIGTDNNGDVCGSFQFEINQDKTAEYYVQLMDYETEINPGSEDFTLYEIPTDIEIENCYYNEDPGYKPGNLQVNNTNNPKMIVYPTLFSDDSQPQLFIDLTGNTGNCGVSIYSVSGAIVLQKNYDLQNSASLKSIDISALRPGNYFVRIQGNSKLAGSVFKFSKM